MSSAGNGRLITVERGGETLGYVAIDSAIHGRARGGLRMAPDLDPEEVRDAARAMTLKYGFLRLPQGGAKAGVIGDPTAPLEERRERLLAFGRAIEPLLRAREYVPDADMGTKASDMRWMLTSMGLPVLPREWRSDESGSWTAVSVVGAAKGALSHRKETIARKSVAIEGFGAVGSEVARNVAYWGGRVVAISTSLGALYEPRGFNVEQLLDDVAKVGHRVVESRFKGERLETSRLLELPVDVLFPCARRHSIHAENAPRVRASVVCPGANDPVSPEAEAILLERRITSVPDFVANLGGVLGGTMRFASVDPRDIVELLDGGLNELVHELMTRAKRAKVPLRAYAEGLALERFAEMKNSPPRASVVAALLEQVLSFYRRGWLPGKLTAVLSQRYFSRRLQL